MMRLQCRHIGFASVIGLALASPALAVAAQASPLTELFDTPEVREARLSYREFCGPDAVAITDKTIPLDRVKFAAPAGKPARIMLCLDDEQMATFVEIATIDEALVFMATRDLAPFWPAAQARWGADLAVLRDEVRARSLDQAVKSYPYARYMDERYSTALMAADIAREAGDFDRSLALVQAEIDFIASRRAKRRGSLRDSFAMSLLLGQFVNTVAMRDGPDGAADRMKPMLALYPISQEYRPNAEINYAATLAEAGRADEALSLIEPVFAQYRPDPTKGKAYEIPGSVREFSWIMACALHHRGEVEEAKPFIALVNGYQERPVDPYVTWTKASTEIRLRMAKCIGDERGFLEIYQQSQIPLLSAFWLEFQTRGRPTIGSAKFPALGESVEGQKLSARFRQLPESYWPALERWASAAAAQ